MKKLLLLSIFVSAAAMGQNPEEPEIIYEGSGKIVLEDGTVQEGTVHHSRVTQRRISIKAAPEDKYNTYKTKEVKEFFIDELHFVKVETPGLGVKDPDFALLRSQEDAAIKVYEVCWQENLGSGSGGGAVWPTHRQYYVLFPNQSKMKGIGDLAYTSSKKIAKYVKDCPELAGKLSSKQSGYAYGMIANDAMKLDVFLKVSEEYRACQ